MKQIARLISFDELHKLPEGTEFTACFTDTVKHDLPPVILKKRDARNYAEKTLDDIQILGTDRDGVPHAILKGTAVFSVTLTAAEEPAPLASVNPDWTAEELIVIRQLAAVKDMPPSQVLRQALRMYQAEHQCYMMFHQNDTPAMTTPSDPAGYPGEQTAGQ